MSRAPDRIRRRMAGMPTRWEAFAAAIEALMPLWRGLGIMLAFGTVCAFFWLLWAITPVS